jgi:hypothetical protein
VCCLKTVFTAHTMFLLKHPEPDHEPCIGEVALFPIMLGVSSTLLNPDHDSVYFKGMPFFRGRVGSHSIPHHCCL